MDIFMFVFYIINVSVKKVFVFLNNQFGTLGTRREDILILDMYIERAIFALTYVGILFYNIDFGLYLYNHFLKQKFGYFLKQEDPFMLFFAMLFLISSIIVYLYFYRNNRYKRYFEKYERMDSLTKSIYSLGGLVLFFLPPILFFFCIS